MTREEAIEVIKLAMAQVEWDYPMDYAAAFDMAIKALEQEPTTKNDLGVDCISRKAILDELKKWDWQELYLPIHFKQMLDELPTVTPQEPFKPMVEIDLYSVIKQKYIEREVLDKIRAEIEQLPTNTRINWDGCCPDIDYPEIEYVDVSKAGLLEIINKYKAESGDA